MKKALRTCIYCTLKTIIVVIGMPITILTVGMLMLSNVFTWLEDKVNQI